MANVVYVKRMIYSLRVSKAYIYPAILFSLLLLLMPSAHTLAQVKDYGEDQINNEREKGVEFLHEPLAKYMLNKEGESNWDFMSATDRGKITLRLLLFDAQEEIPNTSVDGGKIIWFTDCNAISPQDPNLSPPPWGEYPYGLYRCRVRLSEDDFDPNYQIIMEVQFEGQTDPLNARYCAQEFDIEEKERVWVEFDRDSGVYFPEIGESIIKIKLSDTRRLPDQEIGRGFGDSDPNQWVIEHIGGLLWPIPGDGRCFILLVK